MYKIIQQGFCYAFGKTLDKKAKLKWYKVPAYCLYAETEKHKILIDTGYSNEFFNATKKLPYKIMRFITPVEKQILGIKKNFKDNGIILDKDVKILITHLHPDHIGSLKEFTANEIYLSQKEYETFENLDSVGQTKSAYLKELLPKNFKYIAIEDTPKTLFLSDFFEEVHDIFEDQSVFAFSLFGHSPNQFGFYIPHLEIIYVGDAVYTLNSLLNDTELSKILSIIAWDKAKAKDSFIRLKKFVEKNKQIKVIISHDIFLEGK